ncbi:MAG: NAD-binding protein, partial [Halobacteria archaeon]|nr:NAD-binding protein [Halobacteria archaeon]
MYIIIVGAGDIGSQLIDLATQTRNEIVVIEKDDEKAELVSMEHDCLVINDDATTKETLEDAGAERADAIISTTDKDATNVMVMLLAEELD